MAHFFLSRVDFVVFIVSSFVGVAPGMTVYVYLGSLSRDLTSAWSSGSSSKWNDVFYLVLIVVTTVAIIGMVTYIAKKELKKAMAELEEQDKAALDLELQNTADLPVTTDTTITSSVTINLEEGGGEIVEIFSSSSSSASKVDQKEDQGSPPFDL